MRWLSWGIYVDALRSKVGIPSGWWISDRPRLVTRFEAREPVPIPTLGPWARVSPDARHWSVVTRLVCEVRVSVSRSDIDGS